jgi:hypothetical protein
MREASDNLWHRTGKFATTSRYSRWVEAEPFDWPGVLSEAVVAARHRLADAYTHHDLSGDAHADAETQPKR